MSELLQSIVRRQKNMSRVQSRWVRHGRPMTPLELKLLPEYRFTTTDPSAFLGRHHHENATTAYMRTLFRQYFHPSHPSIDLNTQASILQMVGCHEDDPYLYLVDEVRALRAPP